jgi:Ca2+-binding RTX toxin-like protein
VKKVVLLLAVITALALTSVASAQIMLGTNGNDVIQGTSQDDFIRGLAGNDTIAGGGGADVIYGARGNDRIKVYSPGDEKADVVRCGPGIDYVAANKNDHVASNCERVQRS